MAVIETANIGCGKGQAFLIGNSGVISENVDRLRDIEKGVVFQEPGRKTSKHWRGFFSSEKIILLNKVGSGIQKRVRDVFEFIFDAEDIDDILDEFARCHLAAICDVENFPDGAIVPRSKENALNRVIDIC